MELVTLEQFAERRDKDPWGYTGEGTLIVPKRFAGSKELGGLGLVPAVRKILEAGDLRRVDHLSGQDLRGGSMVAHDVEDIYNSRVRGFYGGHICSVVGASHIGDLSVGADVDIVRGASYVGKIGEDAKIGFVNGNSQIDFMGPGSNVVVIDEGACVKMMDGDSYIGGAGGDSYIGEMINNSHIGILGDFAKVGRMRDHAKIASMKGASQVVFKEPGCEIGKRLGGSTQVGAYDSKDDRPASCSLFE